MGSKPPPDEPEPTTARVELTLTFTTKPDAVPLPDKKVGFGLVDDTGIVFWCPVNAKTWRKAEQQMEELPCWAGKVKGKIDRRQRHRICLRDVGIQVFETARSIPSPGASEAAG